VITHLITQHQSLLSRLCNLSGVRAFKEDLIGINWSYLILDEADRIRNPDADISLVCKSFPTPHRLAITGSPIQNNLKELWYTSPYCVSIHITLSCQIDNHVYIPL
jgi:SNF2 family DNA or RNA helicase